MYQKNSLSNKHSETLETDSLTLIFQKNWLLHLNWEFQSVKISCQLLINIPNILLQK